MIVSDKLTICSCCGSIKIELGTFNSLLMAMFAVNSFCINASFGWGGGGEKSLRRDNVNHDYGYKL